MVMAPAETTGTTAAAEVTTAAAVRRMKTQQLTKAELPDSKLTFVAYPLGKGDLHIRVRLKNETNSGNGLLLTSQNNQDYEAQLDFNADNLFVLSLYDGETFLGLVQYRVGYYANLADDTHRWGTIHPPSLPIWTGPAWT